MGGCGTRQCSKVWEENSIFWKGRTVWKEYSLVHGGNRTQVTDVIFGIGLNNFRPR